MDDGRSYYLMKPTGHLPHLCLPRESDPQKVKTLGDWVQDWVQDAATLVGHSQEKPSRQLAALRRRRHKLCFHQKCANLDKGSGQVDATPHHP